MRGLSVSYSLYTPTEYWQDLIRQLKWKVLCGWTDSAVRTKIASHSFLCGKGQVTFAPVWELTCFLCFTQNLILSNFDPQNHKSLQCQTSLREGVGVTSHSGNSVLFCFFDSPVLWLHDEITQAAMTEVNDCEMFDKTLSICGLLLLAPLCSQPYLSYCVYLPAFVHIT